MTTFTDLLAALAGVPRLPGAKCRGRHALFDEAREDEALPDVERRHRAALEVCADCPVLRLCADWIAALPPADRPGGVVAGQILPHPPARRRTPVGA